MFQGTIAGQEACSCLLFGIRLMMAVEDLLWHTRRVKALLKMVATPTRSSGASSSTAGKSLNPAASSCVSAAPSSTLGPSFEWARTTVSNGTVRFRGRYVDLIPSDEGVEAFAAAGSASK